ncbi:hypothetical protein [Spiroplasma endosymbiont of Labia minor]|uniref:hypothetical protein n=1 Tax=Spiroplasma endosymbiont of Labia minor TaxID=3066305 RepID=UPI0030CFE786
MQKTLSQRIKLNFRVIGILYKIYLKNFFTDSMNVFLGIIVAAYTIICWALFKTGDPYIIVSGLAITIIRDGMYTFIRSIIVFKNTQYLQNMRNIQKNNSILIFSLTSFNFLFCLLLVIVFWGIGLIILPEGILYFTIINWPALLSGFFLCWVLSFLIAITLYLYIKNNFLMQTIGLFIYFLSMYFLGLAFPYHVILTFEWADIFTYFLPHRAIINFIQAAYVNAMSFHYVFTAIDNSGWTIDFGWGNHWWLAIIATLAWILFFSILIFIKQHKQFSAFFIYYKGYSSLNSEQKEQIMRLSMSTSMDNLKNNCSKEIKNKYMRNKNFKKDSINNEE